MSRALAFINVSVFVLFVNLRAMSTESTNDNTILEVTGQFARARHWKSILFVTDHAAPTSLIRYFTNLYIPASVIPARGDFLNLSLSKLVENQIVLWCSPSTPCIENIIQLNVTFYKSIRWLMVFENKDAFSRNARVISEHLRVDSQVFALIKDSSYQRGLAIVKIEPCFNDDANLTLRSIGNLNPEKGDLTLISDEFGQAGFESLRNRTIRVLTFDNPIMGIVIDNVTNAHSGFKIEIMNILSEYLQFNQSYITIPALVLTDLSENGLDTWTLSLHMTANGSAEVHAFGVPFMAYNFAIMDITSSYIHEFGQVAVIKNVIPDKSIIQAFAYPFANEVWVCTISLFSLLLLGSVLSLAFSPLWSAFKINKFYQRFNVVIDVFLHSSALSNDMNPAGNKANKIFINVMFCFLLIITIFYGSFLTAALSSDKGKVPYDSMEDLLNDGGFKFGTQKDCIIENLFNDSKPGQGVFGRINETGFEVHKSLKELFEKVQKGQYAFIYPLMVITYLECEYYILPKHEYSMDMSHAFPKKSDLKEPFSVFMLRLRSSGILTKITKEFTTTTQRSCEQHGMHIVNLRQTAIVFITIGVGLLASSSTLLLEIALSKCSEY